MKKVTHYSHWTVVCPVHLSQALEISNVTRAIGSCPAIVWRCIVPIFPEEDKMESFGLWNILIPMIFTTVVICCSTRFLSGRRLKGELVNGTDEQRPALVPYWIPYFGHLFSLCVNPVRFLDYSRCVTWRSCCHPGLTHF